MIYKAASKDLNSLSLLAIKLWDNNDINNLKLEFENIVNNENNVIYLYSIDNKIVGFAQCQLRFDYVEGTENSPVAYLEGIYVEEEYRLRGIAKALIKECEKWAINKSVKEFASDCELINKESLLFHLNMGFKEANRIICFVKKIEEE